MALKLQAVLSPTFSSKVTTRQQNTANAHVEFDVSWSGRLQGFDWMLLLLYSKPDCFKRKLRFKRRERMKQVGARRDLLSPAGMDGPVNATRWSFELKWLAL